MIENSFMDNRVVITPEQFDNMINMLTNLKEKYFERLVFYATKYDELQNKKNKRLDNYEKMSLGKRIFYQEDMLKKAVWRVNNAIWDVDKRIKNDTAKE
jgi:hypothetical protein